MSRYHYKDSVMSRYHYKDSLMSRDHYKDSLMSQYFYKAAFISKYVCALSSARFQSLRKCLQVCTISMNAISKCHFWARDFSSFTLGGCV